MRRQGVANPEPAQGSQRSGLRGPGAQVLRLIGYPVVRQVLADLGRRNRRPREIDLGRRVEAITRRGGRLRRSVGRRGAPRARRPADTPQQVATRALSVFCTVEWRWPFFSRTLILAVTRSEVPAATPVVA